MKDTVKKSFLLGLGAASLTKSQAEKIIKGLVRKNAVTISEGKGMLKRIKKHATNEGKRIKKFAQQEANRVAKERGVGEKEKGEKGKKKRKEIKIPKLYSKNCIRHQAYSEIDGIMRKIESIPNPPNHGIIAQSF